MLTILIFLAIPILIWVVVMVLSLPEVVEPEEERRPVAELYAEGAPRFTRDYTGKLWVERRRKGFFRTLRGRNVPPPGEKEE
jgi:hypothetical protein